MSKHEDVSDGYHTFGELYEHRHALYLNLVALLDDDEITWKSKLHDDGTMFPDFFIAGMDLPVGKVTYHLPLRYWDHCAGRILGNAPEYDGHTPDDCLQRLFKMVGIVREPRITGVWGDALVVGAYQEGFVRGMELGRGGRADPVEPGETRQVAAEGSQREGCPYCQGILGTTWLLNPRDNTYICFKCGRAGWVTGSAIGRNPSPTTGTLPQEGPPDRQKAQEPVARQSTAKPPLHLSEDSLPAIEAMFDKKRAAGE